MKKLHLRLSAIVLLCASISSNAQVCSVVTSSENNIFKSSRMSLSTKPAGEIIEQVSDAPEFLNWGMTFNELDWDALQMLSSEKRKEVIGNIFAPDGQLRMNMGRISPGANDYARSWYSCDEVSGDFELKYFNIERDKEAIIPFIQLALTQNPDIEFWISPWSPPSWMKINHDYCVLSNKYNTQDPKKDYILFCNDGMNTAPDEQETFVDSKRIYPKRLATTDYFIQDPRYLQTYANYFCRFIDAYKAEGINIRRVMYQNEAYSYTTYPGCAWTEPSMIRFNRDYLAPALKKNHPEVKLWLGTFNTNRLNHVKRLLADKQLLSDISGIGFQWEGRDILPVIHKEHPNLEFMCTESECGWGSFDWAAGEHTFELINHYLSNGCNRYNIWNVILADNGESGWGWKQNALIRVNSSTKEVTYTPEYQAVRHYTQFVPYGSRVIGSKNGNTPITEFKTPSGEVVVVAGNLTDTETSASIPVGKKYLNIKLAPHSYQTIICKKVK